MLPPEEPPEPHFENELQYLEYVWRDPTKSDRLRYMAAKACAREQRPIVIGSFSAKDMIVFQMRHLGTDYPNAKGIRIGSALPHRSPMSLGLGADLGPPSRRGLRCLYPR